MRDLGSSWERDANWDGESAPEPELARRRDRRAYGGSLKSLAIVLASAVLAPSVPVSAQGLEPIRGVAEVTAGGVHTCALTTAGGVKCWGDNGFGQLGNNATANALAPVDVSGLASGVARIAPGGFHTCALTTAGGVKCWGRNNFGQLGNNSTANAQTPVDVSSLASGVVAIAAGGDHTCALTSGGRVRCWGDNQSGQLGNNLTTRSLTPVDVSGLASLVASIAAGGRHTCGQTTTGGVKCWGFNFFGQLGNNSTANALTPVDVSSLASGVTGIATGSLHTCARTDAGGVKCWGYNQYGQLGNNSTANALTPVDVVGLAGGVALIAAIEAGGDHTCARTNPGGVKCWGYNQYGQLGNNSIVDARMPVDVSGLASGVTGIAAGSLHTCARTNPGGVKCWGYNNAGQLGDNSQINYLTPVDVVAPGGGPGPPTLVPSVTLSVSPERITQSGSVMLLWVPFNVSSCTPSGGAPGTVFSIMPNNTATAAVAVGAQPRNDIFRINCTGPNGSASNTAVLSVGVPPAPPPRPIANLSVGSGGAAADGGSSNVSLSDGARFVVFESNATNLVAGDTNGRGDVFRRDTMTGNTVRVSLDNGVQQNLFSGEAQVSRDGRFVVFTRGTGTGPGATLADKAISGGEICFRDMQGNVLLCVTKGPGGAAPNGASAKPSVSADGGKLVYESTASNIAGTTDGNGAVSDIFAYTKSTNTTQLVSNTSSGAAATAASNSPHLSCNGNNIVFESLAPLLGSGATTGIRNIYAGSFGGGGKRLVSRGLSNANANGDSRNARISDDGRYVFFESVATNLVAGDSNGRSDVFVHDNASGMIRRLSVSSTGVQANGDSQRPRIPCDGTYVMFDSTATNLVAGDGNGQSDVFLVDLGTGTVALASQSGTGAQGNGNSGNGQVSPDGTAIGFDSNAGNLGGVPSGSIFAGSNPFASQNFTGAWFDPSQSGHGLFLDQLPDGRIVAWWFTFDPSGQQAWFGGTGLINGKTAVINVVRTQGARFIPNFVPAQAVSTPIGTLTFNFTGCASGRVDFALDATFGTGSMNLTRLSAPVGVACTPTTEAVALAEKMGLPNNWNMAHSPDFGPTVLKAMEPTAGPIAGMTGAWFDPAQSGHGLFIENLGNGSLLAWWFTFGPAGGQAWFGGVGMITSGTRAIIPFTRTAGGRWIPNFNPANVTNPALGTGEIVLSSCSAGQINFQFGQGLGTGSMALVPLIRAAGTSCNG